MQIVGSFAECERAMIRKRTSAGLAQARIEGCVGGRRPKLDPKQKADIIEGVISSRGTTAEMAHLPRVAEPTVSRVLAAARQQGNAV